MKGFLTILSVPIVVALGACATEATKTDQEQAKNDNVVCSQERPIGSNIAVTRCRTQEGVESERSATVNILNAPNRGAGQKTYKPGN